MNNDDMIIALTQLILSDVQHKFRANGISPEVGVVIINAVAKQIQDVYITRSILEMINIDDGSPAEGQAEQEDTDGNPA